MNEETYYERMENSSKDKMSALKYFNPGDSILDFGAGKSVIRNPFQRIGSYTAYDSNPEMTNYYKDHAIRYIEPPIDPEEHIEEFDIIYFSSVVHEMFSHLIRERPKGMAYTEAYNLALDSLLDNIFKNCTKMLKPGGKVVIRDWVDISPYYNSEHGLYIRPSFISDFESFYEDFRKEHPRIQLEYDSNSSAYSGLPGDTYEVMYHFNWGAKSEFRENKEIYGVLNDKIVQSYLLENNIQFKVKENRAYFTKDYLPYLLNKLTLLKNGNATPYFPNKMLMVIEIS